MNNTKHSIAVTLFACMSNGKSHYTKVGVRKLQELLKSFQEITAKRRWLFACLADMEGQGLIRRKARYFRNPDGTFVQLSSMITFTLAGVKYLIQKKVTGALQLLKQMLAFLARKDKRWPGQDTIAPQWAPEEVETNKRRLRALIESLG